MKMLRKIAIPVLLLMVLSLCVVLSSCKKECAHEYGDWTVTKEATCTENGEQVRTCALCEATETQVITAGHKADGLLCSVCGDVLVSVDSLVPTVNPETASIGVVIKDFTFVAEEKIEIKLAEALLYIDENGAPAIYANGAADVTFGDVTKTATLFAFTDGPVIYVKQSMEETSYFAVSLTSALESNPEVTEAIAMIEALMPSIEAWISESLLPCFKAPTLPEGVELPEVNEETAKKAAAAVLDLFFTTEQTADGVVVALDLSIIKDVNNALNEKTVAQLIDAIAGEGSFNQLTLALPRILAFSVEDFIQFISLNLGVDVPALLEALDELAVIITGSEEATFETLIGLEGNIEDILADEEFLATTVKDVLMMLTETEDETQLDAMIAEVIGTLNTVTFYQLTDVSEEIPTQINSTVDMIASMLSYEIKVGTDGKFVSSTLTFTEPDSGITAVALLTAEKLSVSIESGENGPVSALIEVIPGYTTTQNEALKKEVKDMVAKAPAITEELIANNYRFSSNYGYDYFPVYENEELVGVYVWDGSYNTITNDDGTYSIGVRIEYWNVLAVSQVELITGCSTKLEISYSVAATEEVRLYTVNAEQFDALEDPNAYVLSLIPEAEFILQDSYSTSNEYITVGYDYASGEFVEDSDHDYEYDTENSITYDSVNCGETVRDVYVCTVCGDTRISEYEKEHGDEVVKSAVTKDEATGVYTVTLQCGCGTEIATTTFTVDSTELELVITSDTEDDDDSVDFDFSATTAGYYRITVIADGDSYAHVYDENGTWTGNTLRFNEGGSDGEIYVDGSGSFDLIFYDWQGITEVTVIAVPVN